MMKDFLQSAEWNKFQESFGRKAFFVGSGEKQMSVIEHELPIIGKYLYVPKGVNSDKQASVISGLIELAEKERATWIRLDVSDEEALETLKDNTKLKIVKAPHDTQPREIFVVDISKSPEKLLSEMKPKTRYNIRLAEKKGVKISCHPEFISGSHNEEKMLKRVQHDNLYLDEFLRLTKIMAKRQGIAPHPDDYYRKMLEIIPGDILKLYVAEYEGRIIAADLVVFYGNMATYLHGASDDAYRNAMAPYLLKWQEMQDAGEVGLKSFDFGGVDTEGKKWQGITKFKLGFSMAAGPIKSMGSWDVIVRPWQYGLYRVIQKVKGVI